MTATKTTQATMIRCCHTSDLEYMGGMTSPGRNFAHHPARVCTMMSSGFMEKTLAQVASRIQ